MGFFGLTGQRINSEVSGCFSFSFPSVSLAFLCLCFVIRKAKWGCAVATFTTNCYHCCGVLWFDLQPRMMFVNTFLKIQPEHSKAAEAIIWQNFVAVYKELTEFVAGSKH